MALVRRRSVPRPAAPGGKAPRGARPDARNAATVRRANDPAPAATAFAGTMKSLAKGLQALDLLVQRGEVGTTEVAQALAIDKGGASRILRTLTDAGFAVQGPARRFQPGPRLLLARMRRPAGPSIRERARGLLERLQSVTGETAMLAVPADDCVLYLDRIAAELPLRVDRPAGTLAPLHCTALGKIFVAFGVVPLPARLASEYGRTTADREALARDLAAIVQRGYALDDEAFAPGIRCVAAALRDGDGNVVAAIGVSGPTARIARERLDDLGVLVRKVAAQFDP